MLAAFWVASLVVFLICEAAFYYRRRHVIRQASSASVSADPSSTAINAEKSAASSTEQLLQLVKEALSPVHVSPPTPVQSLVLIASFGAALAFAVGLAIAVSQTSYRAIPEMTMPFSVKLAAFNATAMPGSSAGSIHSFCQTFRLPDDAMYHITAVNTVLDSSATFVSMALYASSAGSLDTVNRCARVQNPQAMQLVQMCTRGQTAADCAITFSPEAGVLISSGVKVNTPLKVLMIQLSYVYMGAPDLSIPTNSDRPSFELSLTKALRPYDIGVLAMGGFPYEFSIPGGESLTEYTSYCAPRFTDAFIAEPLHVVSYGYSAYQYANSVGLYTVHKDGSAGPTFVNSNFSSKDPMSYTMHQPMAGEKYQFQQHDTIRISCTYNTSSASPGVSISGGLDPAINEACSVRVMYWPTSKLIPLVCANISSFDIEYTFELEDVFAYSIAYEPAFVIASFLAWYAAFWIINAILVRVSVHYVDLSMEKKRLVLGYFIEIVVQVIFLVLFLRVIWLTWVTGEFIGAHLVYFAALSYYTVIMYICELIVRCDVSVSSLAHHLATTCLFLIAIYPPDIKSTAVWEFCVLMIVFVFFEMPTFVALVAYRLCGNPVIVRRVMQVSIVTYIITRAVNDIWAIYILAARGGEMGIIVIALVIFAALIIYAQFYSFMAQYGIYKRVDKACKELERANKPSAGKGPPGKGPPGVLMRQASVAAKIEAAELHSETIDRLSHKIEHNRTILASLKDNDDEASIEAMANLVADIEYLEASIARLEFDAVVPQSHRDGEGNQSVELTSLPTFALFKRQMSLANTGTEPARDVPGHDIPHGLMAPSRIRANSHSLDPDADVLDALDYSL